MDTKMNDMSKIPLKADMLVGQEIEQAAMASGYQEIKIPRRPIESYVLVEHNRLKDHGCDCATHDVRNDKAKAVYVKVRRKGTKNIHTYTFNGTMPTWFTLIAPSYGAHVWDYIFALDDTSPFDTVTAHKASFDPYHVTRKGVADHSTVGIVLYKETVVTCEDTGITYKCNLPTPENFNFPTISYLADYDNVRKILHGYGNKGIMIEKELEPQVLAGILITILRHKQLIIHCKDAAKANAYLRSARQETLAYAIRWFNSRSSVQGMPLLSLELADSLELYTQLREYDLSDAEKRTKLAENTILQYIKACRGDSQTEDTSEIRRIEAKNEKARVKGKIKVYTDKVMQEVKSVERGSKEAKILHAKLVSDYPGQHTIFLNTVKANIGILNFMADDKRKVFADKIRSTFVGNGSAAELANIFNAVSTNAIEDDLLSFTHEYTKAKEEYIAAQTTGKQNERKAIKVDFLSKLAIKKTGGNNE